MQASMQTSCHSAAASKAGYRTMNPCLHPAPPCRSRPAFRQTACSSTTPASVKTAGPKPALLPLDAKYEELHSFTEYSNWVVPGHVMVGRYPYVEPSRCLSRDMGDRQLEQILQAGVTTFVGLQAELPPQTVMTLGGKDGFLPYKATAELIRAALAGPPPMELVQGSLRNPNLDKFLPITKKRSSYHPVELQFLHHPIPDFGVPTAQAALQSPSLTDFLADLQRRVLEGEVLYIHCWGGRGRSGVVVACLLVHMYKLQAAEALERVQRGYATRGEGDKARSPETDEQVSFVKAFAKGG